MYRLHTIPVWQRILYPGAVWEKEGFSDKIYLTFDDGPTEEISVWILDILDKYNASATFFMVGENVKKHPDIFKKFTERNHTLANHTMHHLNGWKTPLATYIDDVELCASVLPGKLFRPPYGKLSYRQLYQLRQNGYEIIMWSFLTYDFDEEADMQTVFAKMKKEVKGGSILVFHDNIKAEKNLKKLLPLALDYFTEQGYSFEAL